MFDIGSYDINNDSSVMANSEIGARFENQSFNLPRDTDMLGYDFKLLPFFLLGDEIRPLRPWLLRPFSVPEHETVYNYRHSTARRNRKTRLEFSQLDSVFF